jgi:Zn-dependent peptidase ImmA (M78 family)
MKLSDIELIVKDLGRKQEFLKSRILSGAKPNEFLGLVAKDMKSGATNRAIALRIRSFLEIDLSLARGLSKGGVLEYLCRKAEDRGVLVSFSSYNFMPQNIDKEIGVSGFCVKDKKFPYVFINNRDGDEKPIVLETAGRQIFTLTAMLVCVAMNKFVLNTKSGKVKGDPAVRVFSIVGEVLIPKEDVDGLVVTTLADLKECADKFKVTPSMLLMRLRETKRIDTKLADSFKIALKKEIEDAGSKGRPRTPTQTTGYGKYNGERFSREVVRSFKSGKISAEEFRNVLFRKGKMDPSLTSKYSQKYL